MKTTVSALLGAVLSWGVLVACGEKHDILGSRADGGGPAGGTSGSGGEVTGGTSAAAGKGGSAGGATGGSGGQAGGGGGPAAGGSDTGGQAGAGEAGGAGGTSGSGGGGMGGVGVVSGGAGGSSGEGGASTGGTGGIVSGGTGGEAPTCPVDCTPGTNAGCVSGQVSWECGAGRDHQELIDGGCTDQGTALPRYCCPPEFHADCSPCDVVTTLDACEARDDCHSVFTDPNDCSCAPAGCCARFSRCADGNRVSCDGPSECGAATPFCDGTVYVLSYVNSCFEGCVKPEDCEIQ